VAPRQKLSQVCIFSRPDFDDTAVRWGTYWTKKLIDKCLYQVVDLYKDLATRAENEAAIKANPTAFYYGFGHGNEDVFTGQNLQAVIDYDNIELWAEAWVHLLSCSVFARLGLKFKHGSGYNRTYYFYISTYPNSVAEQYFDSDHQYPLAVWLKDASAGEAQAALKKAYTDYFAEGRTGNDYLPWDRDSHIITCDPGDHWKAAPGIRRVQASHKFQDGDWTLIGDMAKQENDVYSLKWKFPKEGVCRLRYDAEDTEGNKKAKETGDFTIKFPESPIEIVPIWPVGGEVIEAKAAEIKTQVRYLG